MSIRLKTIAAMMQKLLRNKQDYIIDIERDNNIREISTATMQEKLRCKP